jgi:4-alpha-glucanotransferase
MVADKSGQFPFDRRRAGVLVHVSSLAAKFGIGDFGPAAYALTDFLAQAGMSLWQILPLNPVNPSAGNSPYSSFSAFAVSPLFLSPKTLVADGLLASSDLDAMDEQSAGRINYNQVHETKAKVCSLVLANALPFLDNDAGFKAYCRENHFWLNDFALFMALKDAHQGLAWTKWPKDLRRRDPKSLELWRERLSLEILGQSFMQYLLDSQWSRVRAYCRRKGIAVLGDLPMYVSLDSADVWANPRLFQLDAEFRPLRVSGAPPDYFSKTGQFWGNPLYDWKTMAADGFCWWKQRMQRNAALFDAVRIDHFRGLAAYWSIPADARSAREGKWISGPGRAVLQALFQAVPDMPVVAEDLGEITPDVHVLRDAFCLPGMRILQFGFSGDPRENPHVPHNHVPCSVVYTGTHDNTTTRDWFQNELSLPERDRVGRYLGCPGLGEDEIASRLSMAALSSCARTCILPVQDILNLAAEGRMNMPSLAQGNWTWRMMPGDLQPALAAGLRTLVEMYGRLP